MINYINFQKGVDNLEKVHKTCPILIWGCSSLFTNQLVVLMGVKHFNISFISYISAHKVVSNFLAFAFASWSLCVANNVLHFHPFLVCLCVLQI